MILEAIKFSEVFSDYTAVTDEKVRRLKRASMQRAEAIYALRVETRELRRAAALLESENRLLRQENQLLRQRAKDAESRLDSINYLTGDKS